MKKFVYLCGMMLLCMNMMAQIDNNRQLDNSMYCSYRTKHLQIHYDSTHIPLTPGWRYDSVHSDEFNTTTIDRSKWDVKHRSWQSPNQHVGFLDSNDNVKVSGGKLYLSVTENTDSLDFTCSWCGENHSSLTIIPELISGWVKLSDSFRYGYIETKCHLPKNHNYWPCFWTVGGNKTIDDYDEVDVFERTRNNQTNYPNIIRQNCYNGINCTHHSYLSQILTLNDSISGKETLCLVLNYFLEKLCFT